MSVRLLASVGVARLAGLLLALAFFMAVTAVVPPEIYGRFNLVLSVIQVSCATVLAWPNQPLLRFGREAFVADGTLGAALGGRLVLHLALSVPLAGLILVTVPMLARWVGVETQPLRLMMLTALIVLPLPDMGLAAAQACGRFRAYAVGPLIQRGLQLAAVAAVLLGAAPTWSLLLGATIAGYGVSGMAAWREVPRRALRLRFAPDILRAMVAYGWTLPLGTLAAFLLIWMDLWFIRAFLDPRAVGLYSWAFTMVLLGTSILVALAAVVGPRAIDLRVTGDTDGVIRLTGGITSLCLLTATVLPPVIGGMAAAAAVIGLKDYQPALVPLLVLVTATLYQMATALMEPVVYAHEHLVTRMVATAVAMAVVKAGIDVLLIPKIGILGAAFATVFSQAVGLLLQRRWVCARLVPSQLPSLPLLLAGLPGLGLALVVDRLPATAAPFLGIGLGLAMVMLWRRQGLLDGLRPMLPRQGVVARVGLWLAVEAH